MKKAFTVAEGLVTLVIMGVLASVMVSTVLKEKPDKNKIMIRNAYAELTGVVSQLVADSTLYPDFAEFGLGDNTRVSVWYGGTSLFMGDNREKMCVGIRHYFNAITQEYIKNNIKDGNILKEIPCRADFYTKNGVKVRFEVNKNNEEDYKRYIIMDANPANSREIECGEDMDTLRVRITKSGKLYIANSGCAEAAKSIIKEAQIR